MMKMAILQKLKTMKKKWLCLIAVVVVLLLAAGIAAAALHERFDRHEGERSAATYQTYYDLLYLENVDTLKLTPDQAKTLEPLVEKLNAASDKTTKNDLEKNIYMQLTPQQYYAVLNNGNQNVMMSKRDEHGRFGEGFSGRFQRGFDEEKGSSPADSIKDVVLNMLKAESAK